MHPTSADQQPTPVPNWIQLERQLARRELDEAMWRLLDAYMLNAPTKREAIAAIDRARALVHNDISWYADRWIAKVANGELRLRRHLQAVPQRRNLP